MTTDSDIASLKKRITIIENRNKRVEADKNWETSLTRRLLIALLTYAVITLFLSTNNNIDPFKNAVIPTLGFILSTLSLSLFRTIWKKFHS